MESGLLCSMPLILTPLLRPALDVESFLILMIMRVMMTILLKITKKYFVNINNNFKTGENLIISSNIKYLLRINYC